MRRSKDFPLSNAFGITDTWVLVRPILQIFVWVYAIAWFVGLYATYLWSTSLLLKVLTFAVEVFLAPDLPSLFQSYESYCKMMEKFDLGADTKELLDKQQSDLKTHEKRKVL